VLGIDCEWLSRDSTPGRRRHRVSLLQLASLSGVCVLVRLHLFTFISDSLHQLLADRRWHTPFLSADVNFSSVITVWYTVLLRQFVRLSVRLSVCDVEIFWSHRLEYFKNNFTAD